MVLNNKVPAIKHTMKWKIIRRIHIVERLEPW